MHKIIKLLSDRTACKVLLFGPNTHLAAQAHLSYYLSNTMSLVQPVISARHFSQSTEARSSDTTSQKARFGPRHCQLLQAYLQFIIYLQTRRTSCQSVGASRSRSGLRSSSTSSMDYSLPRLRMKFGKGAFSHVGPATWNTLPDHIRTVADPVKFRKLLKSLF